VGVYLLCIADDRERDRQGVNVKAERDLVTEQLIAPPVRLNHETAD